MWFYNITTKFFYAYFKLMYKLDVEGIENIPSNGRLIVCSNHISLLDPVLLGAVIPRKLNYMAKKELFENKALAFLIKNLGAFPVDRDATGLSAIKTAIKVLYRDNVFAIFPQGQRVHDIDYDKAKPGIAMISIKSKSPIIPIYIDTEYKLFKKIKVKIGSVISFDEYYDIKLKTEDYNKLSGIVLKEIYKLK